MPNTLQLRIFEIFQRLHYIWRSSLFIPFLFLIAQYRILMMRQTVVWDAGDGISAYRLFKFGPVYWNWLHNTGQAFWMDLGWYRLTDPLMWPLIAFAKLLPLDTLGEYNVFLLLRMFVLGVVLALLLKDLGLSVLPRQLSVAMLMFGSVFTTMYVEIGMLDMVSCFTLLFFFILRFCREGKTIYLAGIAASFLHSSSSYHILQVLPVLFLLLVLMGIVHREALKQSLRFIALRKYAVLFTCLACLASMAAAYAAATDPTLHPTLRNINYQSRVDQDGRIMSAIVPVGESIFSTDLSVDPNRCGVSTYCAEYRLEHLASFLGVNSHFSATGFLSLTGLALLVLAFFLVKRKVLFIPLAFTLGCFVLAFGSQTQAWPLMQSVFFFLKYIRHTHVFFELAMLGLVLVAALALLELKRFEGHSFFKQRRAHLVFAGTLTVGYAVFLALWVGSRFHSVTVWYGLIGLVALFLFVLVSQRRWQAAVAVCILLECLVFYRIVGERMKSLTTPEQRQLFDQPVQSTIGSRIWRLHNPYPLPRSAVGTSQGVATAFEAVPSWSTDSAKEIEAMEDPLNFFFITPYLNVDYLRARLMLSSSSSALRKTFGIQPYGPYSEWSVNQLRQESGVRAENLSAIEKDLLVVSELSVLSGLNVSRENSSQEKNYFGPPLQVLRDGLQVTRTESGSAVAYLSVPHNLVSGIEVDGKRVPHVKANSFGVAFGIPEKGHLIRVIPVAGRPTLVFLLYYGSYFILAGLVLFSFGWKGFRMPVISWPKSSLPTQTSN